MLDDDADDSLLAKVQSPGEPLVVTCWRCPTCGFEKRGGPPAACQSDAPAGDCPLGDGPEHTSV